MLAADTINDGHTSLATARLGPLANDFDRIAVYDAAGRRLAQYPADAPTGAPSPEPPWQVEGRPWLARPTFADATGVLKSGNVAVLRIGSDALGTARAIVEAMLGRPARAKTPRYVPATDSTARPTPSRPADASRKTAEPRKQGGLLFMRRA